MTSQQLYDEALKHIEGKGGYPKNPKKGKKTMMEAANAGSRQAAGYCATQYATNEAEMLKYLDMNEAKEDHPNDYVRCLYTLAQRSKGKPETVKGYFTKSCNVKANYHADGYYYYAELGKLAEKDDTWYRDTLYLAALGNSKAMPDATYAYINRTRGVITGKEEVELWVKANEMKDRVAGYGAVTKSEDEAWRIVEANLSTKEGAKKLPAGAASAMLKKHPTPTLEWQRLIVVYAQLTKISVGFEYDDPKYSQVSKGSISDFKVDSTPNGYWFTDFRHPVKQTQAWKDFDTLSYSKNIPSNARLRVSTPYYNALCVECAEQSKKGAMNRAKNEFKDALSKAKNWPSQYISLTVNDHDNGIESFKIYFVPFYFYTVDLAFGKTATVRVNAQTGAVDFFENSPFGQFDEYDDYKKGGGAKLNKELIDAQKRAAERAKTGLDANDRKFIKTSLIGAGIAFVLFLIGGTAKFNGNEILAILGFLGTLVGLGLAAWKGLKKVGYFFKNLFKK